jgi:hypothetical protein
MEKIPDLPKFDKNWRKSRKWLEIKGITSEEIYTPCGAMQRGEPLGKSKFNSSTPAPAQNKKDSKVMGFGKYKNKTREWVMENDKSYFNWCTQNVKGFK